MKRENFQAKQHFLKLNIIMVTQLLQFMLHMQSRFVRAAPDACAGRAIVTSVHGFLASGFAGY